MIQKDYTLVLFTNKVLLLLYSWGLLSWNGSVVIGLPWLALRWFFSICPVSIDDSFSGKLDPDGALLDVESFRRSCVERFLTLYKKK